MIIDATKSIHWKLFCLLCIFCSSCVSMKNTVYLQDKTQEKPHKVDYDGSFDLQTALFPLYPGDVLLVKIEHTPITEPHLTGSTQQNTTPSKSHPFEHAYTIDSDGFLQVPNLGTFKLEGLNIEEAKSSIAEAARKVFKDPVVNLYLMNFEVNVLGEVNTPGKYQIVQSQAQLLDALALAHDVAPFGDKRSVKLVRNRNQQVQIFHLDLTNMDALKDEKIFLRPGDTIIVKALPSKKYSGDTSRWLVLSFSAIISFVAVFFR